jgi:uncharacterized membrane protein (UPF0127 family)
MLERQRERCFLLLPDCRAIHTFFMRVPLDIVFLDHDRMIVGIYRNVQPWRLLVGPKEATATLELPAGGADQYGATLGEQVE